MMIVKASEETVLALLTQEVFKRYPMVKLFPPDYRILGVYSPQWQFLGNSLAYWKMPGDLEPILAAFCRRDRVYYFCAEGIPPDTLKNLFLA